MRDAVVTLAHPTVRTERPPRELAPGKKLVVDCFCGIGGFSAGCELAGHRVVLAVDMSKELLEVHRCNHPDAVHLKMALGPETEAALLAKIREVIPEGADYHVHMSPPCTRLSSMQALKRKGAKSTDVDAGLKLVMWALDFMIRLNPPSFSFEQVHTPELDGLLRFAHYLHPNKLRHVKAFDFAKVGVCQTRDPIGS